VFRTIGVTAETPVQDLIAFRHRHVDEIGRLRAALDELAGKIDSDFPSREAFEQTVLDVFRNAVRPALAELEQAKRARLPKLAPSLLNAGLLTSAPTWVGPVQSYLNTTGRLLAIAAMAGMSLTAIAVKHNAERRAELGKDPYGFLLAARERFGHGPEWNARQRWWRPGQVRRPY
jgi:hypothetical protein